VLKTTIPFLCLVLCVAVPLAAENPAPPSNERTEEAEPDKKPAARPTFDFYGYLKLDASYDDGVIDTGNFARWVTSPSTIESHDHFSMTARQTRLGVRIGREKDEDMIVKGRVEIDFYAGASENKNQPMLRHGYVEIEWPDKGLNLTAGQTSDLISPLVPTTINYPVAWWAGNIGYRRPQIRITKTVTTGDSGSIVAAAALSRSIGDDFGQLEPGDSGADSGVPTVQLAVTRKFTLAGKPAGVGISGHLGKEELRERLGEVVPTFDSWSLGLDYSLPVSPKVTVKGEVWTGQDLDDYLGGIGQGINLVSGDAIESKGGWLAVEITPGPRSFIGVGVSVDDPKDEDLLPGQRSRNSSVWTNYLYNVRSYLRTGLEISHWATDYIDLEDSSAFRLQSTIIYSF